jgi:hypothetical protein
MVGPGGTTALWCRWYGTSVWRDEAVLPALTAAPS